MLLYLMLTGCSSKEVRVVNDCPLVNHAPLRITPIPEPLATETVGDLLDYTLMLQGAIKQCNIDKEFF